MNNNASSHEAENCKEYLHLGAFSGGRSIEWPPSASLNVIEDLWSVVKRRDCQHCHQFSNKVAFFDAIVDAAQSIIQGDFPHIFL